MAAKSRKKSQPVPPPPAVEEAAPLTPEQVQECLNELTVTKGSLEFHPHRDKILAAAGLDPARITPTMFQRADRYVREWLRDRFRRHNGDPAKRFTVVVKDDPEFDPELNPALDGPAKIRQQFDEAHRQEIRDRLAKLRQRKQSGDNTTVGVWFPGTVDPLTQRKVMKIQKQQLVELFVAMSMPGARKWSRTQLADKARKYLPTLGEENVPQEPAKLKLFQAIQQGLSEGHEIEVTDEEAPAAAAAARSSRGKGGATAVAERPKGRKGKGVTVTAVKREKGSPKEKAEGTDAYGCRLGTVRANINAELKTKPRTASEIGSALGLSASRINSVLANAIKRGLPFVKTEEGYALKK